MPHTISSDTDPYPRNDRWNFRKIRKITIENIEAIAWPI
jgi:hypothetical protein